MIHRTALITGLLLSTTAIFAADTQASLQATKLQLKSQLVVHLACTSDGNLFRYPHELYDAITCMKPFDRQIDQAESAAECELIQQKLNLAKAIIRNRIIFEDKDGRNPVYAQIIPNLLALPTLTSPYDGTLQIIDTRNL